MELSILVIVMEQKCNSIPECSEDTATLQVKLLRIRYRFAILIIDTAPFRLNRYSCTCPHFGTILLRMQAPIFDHRCRIMPRPSELRTL